MAKIAHKRQLPGSFVSDGACSDARPWRNGYRMALKFNEWKETSGPTMTTHTGHSAWHTEATWDTQVRFPAALKAGHGGTWEARQEDCDIVRPCLKHHATCTCARTLTKERSLIVSPHFILDLVYFFATSLFPQRFPHSHFYFGKISLEDTESHHPASMKELSSTKIKHAMQGGLPEQIPEHKRCHCKIRSPTLRS